MQLAPYPALVMTVFSDLPFALAKHLQTSRANDQIGDLPLGRLTVCHLHGAGPLADTVIRGAERHVHQLKQRVEQALRCTQGETENPLEHQKGADGLAGVE